MRCYVEPSPAGGYFVRLRGEAAPLSRHDTEEEAQAAAAAYERGLARTTTGEFMLLPDGSEVLVRAIRPEDKPLFATAWKRLSDDTVRRRFLVTRDRLTADELEYFTHVDHVDHEAIGALDPKSGEGVAVARYVRDRDRPHIAEAALTVVDAWQRRGLGWRLLRRLADHALEHRIRVFSATTLADNEAMLKLLGRLGEVRVTGRDGPAIQVEVDLA
jgi:RimJ/RimL family protein N-acetyltransferase